MSAKFDSVAIELFEWPFEIIDDVGIRTWPFQFPGWLDGTHKLVVVWLDETENPDFRYTVTATITTDGTGYPLSLSGPYRREAPFLFR